MKIHLIALCLIIICCILSGVLTLITFINGINLTSIGWFCSFIYSFVIVLFMLDMIMFKFKK